MWVPLQKWKQKGDSRVFRSQNTWLKMQAHALYSVSNFPCTNPQLHLMDLLASRPPWPQLVSWILFCLLPPVLCTHEWSLQRWLGVPGGAVTWLQSAESPTPPSRTTGEEEDCGLPWRTLSWLSTTVYYHRNLIIFFLTSCCFCHVDIGGKSPQWTHLTRKNLSEVLTLPHPIQIIQKCSDWSSS